MNNLPSTKSSDPVYLTSFNSIQKNPKKDDLDYDPFHAIVRLAILNLMKENEPHVKFSIAVKKCKFCIYRSDNIMYKSRFHDVSKYFFYQAPEELYSLRKHIIRALSWFPPETNNAYRGIFQEASKAFPHLAELTPIDFKDRIENDQTLIDNAIKKGANTLEEIPFKIAVLKEKKSKGYEYTSEEQHEIQLYDKFAPLWNPTTAQTVYNLILEKRIKSLRELARENFAKYLEIK